VRENKEASAAERQEAEKGLAESKKSVGEIAVVVGTENADIYVDGNLEGRSPLPGPLYFKPGSHNLEARKDGKTATATVTALAGQSGSVELSFGGSAGPGVAPVPGTGPGPGPDTGPGAPRRAPRAPPDRPERRDPTAAEKNRASWPGPRTTRWPGWAAVSPCWGSRAGSVSRSRPSPATTTRTPSRRPSFKG